MLALRAAGMVLLALLALLYTVAWSSAHLLSWCGTHLAQALDLEDLLDKMPQP